jgi:hypothetical protein
MVKLLGQSCCCPAACCGGPGGGACWENAGADRTLTAKSIEIIIFVLLICCFLYVYKVFRTILGPKITGPKICMYDCPRTLKFASIYKQVVNK